MRTIVRIALVILSVAFTALAALFSLTPIAWHAAGRPDETYPELFYIAFGVPAALALILTTVAQFTPVRSGDPIAKIFVAVGSVGALVLCGFVSATAAFRVVPVQLRSTPLLQAIAGLIAANFYTFWLIASAALVGGAVERARAQGGTAER